MTEAVSIFLLVSAVIAASVVVLPKFKLPLMMDLGFGACAIGLTLAADAVQTGQPVGVIRPIILLVGLGFIFVSMHKERTVKDSGEPQMVDDRDLRHISGGRKQ